MAFKDRLKEARKARGFTQEALANAIGVAKSTVTGYETGNSEPDMRKISAMMSILNVDANYLWQDEMIGYGQKNSPAPAEAETGDHILINKYNRLNNANKQAVDTMIDSLLTVQDASKKGRISANPDESTAKKAAV